MFHLIKFGIALLRDDSTSLTNLFSLACVSVYGGFEGCPVSNKGVSQANVAHIITNGFIRLFFFTEGVLGFLLDRDNHVLMCYIFSR
jgi:hypothetical protein